MVTGVKSSTESESELKDQNVAIMHLSMSSRRRGKGGGGEEEGGIVRRFDIFQKIAVKFPGAGQKTPEIFVYASSNEK